MSTSFAGRRVRTSRVSCSACCRPTRSTGAINAAALATCSKAAFKAKLVEDEVYLLAVTRYIHLNPVKIAACRRLIAAERLERLEAYPWSSYGGYVAASKALEFVNYEVLKEYGRDMAAARRHYRAYVKACVMEDDGPLLEAMAASRYAIGGAEFIERTEERIEQRRSGRVQDQDLDLPRRTVSLEEIDEAVGAITGSIRGCSRRTAEGPGLGGPSPWQSSWRRNWRI